ncbi:MAG: oligosaccharide repeat unit polymerase [Lachnospiraceae bacterium]|nr:oligosaccharide repeat unit polymerase [Lachnospiraceae bacterium]
MNILLLSVILVLILIISIIHNKAELTSPSFVFIAMFIIALIVAFNYREIWWGKNGEIGSNTFLVILTGCTVFCIGTVCAGENDSKTIKLTNLPFGLRPSSRIYRYKYYVFIVVQLITIVLTYRYIKAVSYGSTVSALLGNFRDETVSINVKMPGYLSFLNALTFVGGLFFSNLLAARISKENREPIVLQIISLLLSIIASLLGGSRGGLITMLVSFVCYTLMHLSSVKNWKKNVSIKFLLPVFGGVFIVFYFFQKLHVMLGQERVSSIDFYDYIAIYMGAQIKNLDLYLNSFYERSIVFGQESFRSFVQIISRVFGSGHWSSYRLSIPFRYAGGMALGNVYTTFYAFIRDFGYIGVIILPFIMGFVSQKVYNKAKLSMKTDLSSSWLIIYGYIYYALAFSYFSNKFFEQIICVSMIKYIICLALLKSFFYGISVNKRRSDSIQ